MQESPRGPYLPDGRVSILYERHIFSRLTGHQYDGDFPDISIHDWRSAGYGSYSSQYRRLEAAYALNPEAALKSISYGRFQIMGFNYEEAGYTDVQSFAQAMQSSERAQLSAFTATVKSMGLVGAMRDHNWTAFARTYNGSGQVPVYAQGMLQNYNKLIGK